MNTHGFFAPMYTQQYRDESGAVKTAWHNEDFWQHIGDDPGIAEQTTFQVGGYQPITNPGLSGTQFLVRLDIERYYHYQMPTQPYSVFGPAFSPDGFVESGDYEFVGNGSSLLMGDLLAYHGDYSGTEQTVPPAGVKMSGEDNYMPYLAINTARHDASHLGFVAEFSFTTVLDGEYGFADGGDPSPSQLFIFDYVDSDNYHCVEFLITKHQNSWTDGYWEYGTWIGSLYIPSETPVWIDTSGSSSVATVNVTVWKLVNGVKLTVWSTTQETASGFQGPQYSYSLYMYLTQVQSVVKLDYVGDASFELSITVLGMTFCVQVTPLGGTRFGFGTVGSYSRKTVLTGYMVTKSYFFDESGKWYIPPMGHEQVDFMLLARNYPTYPTDWQKENWPTYTDSYISYHWPYLKIPGLSFATMGIGQAGPPGSTDTINMFLNGLDAHWESLPVYSITAPDFEGILYDDQYPVTSVPIGAIYDIVDRDVIYQMDHRVGTRLVWYRTEPESYQLDISGVEPGKWGPDVFVEPEFSIVTAEWSITDPSSSITTYYRERLAIVISNSEDGSDPPDNDAFNGLTTLIRHRFGDVNANITDRPWKINHKAFWKGEIPGGEQAATLSLDVSYQSIIEARTSGLDPWSIISTSAVKSTRAIDLAYRWRYIYLTHEEPAIVNLRDEASSAQPLLPYDYMAFSVAIPVEITATPVGPQDDSVLNWLVASLQTLLPLWTKTGSINVAGEAMSSLTAWGAYLAPHWVTQSLGNNKAGASYSTSLCKCYPFWDEQDSRQSYIPQSWPGTDTAPVHASIDGRLQRELVHDIPVDWSEIYPDMGDPRSVTIQLLTQPTSGTSDTWPMTTDINDGDYYRYVLESLVNSPQSLFNNSQGENLYYLTGVKFNHTATLTPSNNGHVFAPDPDFASIIKDDVVDNEQTNPFNIPYERLNRRLQC